MATAAIIAVSSRVINPQGEIIATADAHQATRIDAELSMAALREYRESFRHGRMRMSLGCGEWGLCLGPGRVGDLTTKARFLPPTTFITGVWKCFSINRNDVYVV